MQARDALGDDLARADEQIIATEADLSRFDAVFQEVEGETETAAQFVRQVNSKVEQAQSEKEEAKQKSDGHMNERHDLQVLPSGKSKPKPIFSNLLFSFVLLFLTGPATPDQRLYENSRHKNKRHTAEDLRGNPTARRYQWWKLCSSARAV